MRLTFAFLVLSVLAPRVVSGGQAATAWTSYGSPITLKKTSRLDQAMSKQVGKEILVQGKIADVCQAKGCWMTVRDRKQEVRVEFKDYKFFVPSSVGGKSVRLQGVLTEKILSPEDQAHVASESKEGGGVGTPSGQPKRLLTFVATGVAIEGGGAIGVDQARKISGTSEGRN